jgi:hypothetical protein
MDTSRMSQGQMIAGVSGLLLFVFLFLPWLGVEGADDFSGWKSQSNYDVFILIVAVVGMATALTASSGGVSLPGITLSGACVVLGGVATITLLWLIIDHTDGVDTKIGLFLSLLAAIGVTYGGWTAATDEAVGDRY